MKVIAKENCTFVLKDDKWVYFTEKLKESLLSLEGG